MGPSKHEIAPAEKQETGHGLTLEPGLHVVATPIGAARDVTLRALDTLGAADLIACEDTRVTGKLLSIHGIKGRLIAYHEHNGARVRPGLLRRMAAGEAVALVSDAGSPLVSDPGFKLVEAARDAGLAVRAVPGPSAAIAALTVSGLPSDRFLFLGFAPAKSAARRRFLEEVAGVRASLILFETGPRLASALADMAAVLGPRPAAVARELTKLYEEVTRGPLDALAARYGEAAPPRGEITIVIAPPAAPAHLSDAEIDAELRAALASGARVKEAAAKLQRAAGRPRAELYARALALKAAMDGDGEG